jgi:hypothetical protein
MIPASEKGDRMALLTCPDCGGPVSDTAPACPKCGHPRTTVAPVVAVRRAANKTKILGIILTVASFPLCFFAMEIGGRVATIGGAAVGLGLSVLVFIVGVVVFLVGRLQDEE